jgi:hypothetical protein
MPAGKGVDLAVQSFWIPHEIFTIGRCLGGAELRRKVEEALFTISHISPTHIFLLPLTCQNAPKSKYVIFDTNISLQFIIHAFTSLGANHISRK